PAVPFRDSPNLERRPQPASAAARTTLRSPWKCSIASNRHHVHRQPTLQHHLQEELRHAGGSIRCRLCLRDGLQLRHEQDLGQLQPRPSMEGYPKQVRWRGRGR
ncbi:Uncharacterized protein TPAR_00030, partial [Tolypocladium paradoxum]